MTEPKDEDVLYDPDKAPERAKRLKERCDRAENAMADPHSDLNIAI